MTVTIERAGDLWRWAVIGDHGHVVASGEHSDYLTAAIAAEQARRNDCAACG